MKTLIINGSPRKNGDTSSLIDELKKHLDGEIVTVNTYFDDIKPCVDCRYCWENVSCTIDDQMQPIYGLLDEVDNVVIASPIYFYELTGSLLSFASRLQCLWISKSIRKDNIQLKAKKGGILLAGGGKKFPQKAIETATMLLELMNAKVVGSVCALDTDNVPVDDTALKNTAELANKLSD